MKHPELARLFAASFAADFAHYLIHTAVAFKALRLGADPLQLGALAAASTGAYALLVGISGRASDRVPRMTLARLSCIGVVAACMGLTLAPNVERMLMCMPFLGGSVAFFWPCIQASIADRSHRGTLGRNLGRFNLSWSVGKGSGFLLGGMLLVPFGAEPVLTLGSLVVAAIFFVLPLPRATAAVGPIAALLSASPSVARGDEDARTSIEHTGAVAPPADEHAGVAARAAIFRRLAWLANGASYGVVATLVYHYPRLIAAHGASPRTFGIFLGGMYFSQTLAFAWLLRRQDEWRFRRAPLFVPQVLIAVAVTALPLADVPRLVLSALIFAFGLATCYAASIEYSLLADTVRGRNAGVHETLIGIGSMVVPLAGGIAARLTGAIVAPYFVAATAVVLSLVGQEILYRSGWRRLDATVGSGDARQDTGIVASR